MCYIINMKKIVLLVMIAAVTSLSLLYAEDDFEKWKKKQQQAYKSYLSEQEKAFSDMLKKEWEEFQTHSGFILDKSPKPDNPPKAVQVQTPEAESSSPARGKHPGMSKSDKPGTAVQKKSLPEKADNKTGESPSKKGTAEKQKTVLSGTAQGSSIAVKAENKKGIKYINISFYGSSLPVPVPENLKIKENTENINNTTISDFFEYYSEQRMDETSLWLKSLKTDYKMNGWSVLKIAEKTSEKLYSSEKDKILMTWFLLLKSDYDVKIAYSADNIYLLYVSDIKIYASPYITENKKNYYFYNKTSSKQERIRTYSGSFVKKPSVVKLTPENPDHFKEEPNSRDISFKYKSRTYPVNLEYNNSLIYYYSEYPQVDISCYFRKNISDRAIESYRRSLYPYIREMDKKEAVQFILTFVQTGFEYKTDGSQFGYEKPMFPDESLHYPYIDCEDRAALFISIVRELTGLDAVALDYPGHIAAAVNFNDDVKGDYFNYKGKKYIVCDPTYINASIGMTMPDYKNIKPVIIETGK